MNEMANYASEILGDSHRLVKLDGTHAVDLDEAVSALRKDDVVLVRGLSMDRADEMLHSLSARFELADSLQLQAGLASLFGHRTNVGDYFMSVNRRNDYDFVTPHSEGDHISDLQIASLYCIKNTTDGGHTILINIDGENAVWPNLREQVAKISPSSRKLTHGEAKIARAYHSLNSPNDIISNGDQIIHKIDTQIEGIDIFDVLTPPRKSFSKIIGRDIHVYWDNISSIDMSVPQYFEEILASFGLLKSADGIVNMDSDKKRRVWRSNVDHKVLFKSQIALKLSPGDLIIQNNMTWTHSASNWTPGSGVRDLVAAFA